LELILLTVPDCPNAAVFEERLAAVLAGRPDAVVRRREVADERDAAQAGMRGSPTLLINGVDPFAAPGQVPGLACRLYRDATGRAAGAPPVEAIRRAVEQAGAHDETAASREADGSGLG
jgi:hypothetical protein